MKGLLRKDFALIWYQKLYLLVGIVIMVISSFWLHDNMMLSAFGIWFIGFLGANTLVYDEYGQGFSFLLTLPVTRTQFVLSKYISSCIVVVSVYIVQLLMIFARSQFADGVENTEDKVIAASVAAIFIIVMISILIPVTIKFGSEKTNIVIFGTIGAVVAIVFIVYKFFGDSQWFISFVEWLNQLTKSQVIGGVVVLAAVVMVISFFISNKIMKNKDL